MWPDRPYTPETASVIESRAVHKKLGVDRIVIVQPSFYNTDNAATLDGLRQLGPIARGVAVVDDNASKSQLDDMHRIGVRGVRLNFETFAMAGNLIDVESARRRFLESVKQIAGRNWHIQLFTRLSVVEALQTELMASPVPVVIDHFGMGPVRLGLGQTGFPTLLKLLKSGRVYVKLSAPYRISDRADYSDVAPFARALMEANPQRVVWGTDWPHPSGRTPPGRAATDVSPNLEIDNGRLLNLVAEWAPDPRLRKTILVENPARLYDF